MNRQLKFFILISAVSILAISFNTVSKKKNVQLLALGNESNSQTISKISVDDYPISDEFLRKKGGNFWTKGKVSGKLISHDKIWFKNDSLKEILVFEVYTHLFRLKTIHFKEEDMPSELLSQIELHSKDGKLASLNQKLIDIKGFLISSIQINSDYFKSNKGFRIGDIKQKAIEIYGAANQVTFENGVEKLEWSFIGDEFYENGMELNGIPLAQDSYGHQVQMFFRNGKLIGQILHNDIP